GSGVGVGGTVIGGGLTGGTAGGGGGTNGGGLTGGTTTGGTTTGGTTTGGGGRWITGGKKAPAVGQKTVNGTAVRVAVANTFAQRLRRRVAMPVPPGRDKLHGFCHLHRPGGLGGCNISRGG